MQIVGKLWPFKRIQWRSLEFNSLLWVFWTFKRTPKKCIKKKKNYSRFWTSGWSKRHLMWRREQLCIPHIAVDCTLNFYGFDAVLFFFLSSMEHKINSPGLFGTEIFFFFFFKSVWSKQSTVSAQIAYEWTCNENQ